MKSTNWLALLVSVVAAMGIGFLWYGAIFQDQWMAGNGISMAGETMMKNGVEVPMSSLPMILNTIGMILYALILNWLISKTQMTSLVGGATIGLLVGTVVLIDTILGNAFSSTTHSLSMVDGSYILVLLTVMGAIIGAWRKK